jgi:gamma-butyrobetaine dioxygenase
MLHPQSVTIEGSRVIVTWDDGGQSRFHPIWLRDNCPCPECLYAGTGERLLDTAFLRDEPLPSSARVDGGTIEIRWTHAGHKSRYTTAFLRGERRLLRCRTLWRSDIGERLPEAQYADVAVGGSALCGWLAAVDEHGFALLRGVPCEPGAVARVAELFGYVRETNFGRLFDVKAVVNPTNLAYTGLALGPHTDNAYRDPAPTLQLLHCLVSSAIGGDNTLVDAFAVAEALRESAPAKFEILTRQPVLFTFGDAEARFEHEAPVVALDVRGEVEAVRYSTRAAAPFDLPDDLVEPYYDAYRTFGRMLVSPEFQIVFKLLPGDLFIVDNRRVLHGRTGYTGDGSRHIQGCYADIDGLRSKLAILRREANAT